MSRTFSGQIGILKQDWVCSTLFSVQRGHILISPQNVTQILNYQILNICRVLLYSGLSTEKRKSFFWSFFFRFFATENRLFKVGFSVTPKKRNRKTDSVFFGRFFFKWPLRSQKHLHICMETPLWMDTWTASAHSSSSSGSVRVLLLAWADWTRLPTTQSTVLKADS